MKRTLIIPDVHTRFKVAEALIARENPDKTIFLGDYFDAFGDDAETAAQTAAWLKDSMGCKNRIHLLGNHDLAYMDPLGHTCSGFTSSKLEAIRNIGPDLTKLKDHYWMDEEWLCTHAGLSLTFYCRYGREKLPVRQFLRDITERDHSLLYDCGPARGGADPCSGILWCDYSEEFEEIRGTNQVFGHTRGMMPRKGSYHFCIDTELRHYGIYDGLAFEIKRNQDVPS